MSKQVGQMPGASAYLDMRTVNGTRCYGVRGTKWNLVERDQETGEFKPVDKLEKGYSAEELDANFGIWEDKKVTEGMWWWKKTVREEDGQVQADEVRSFDAFRDSQTSHVWHRTVGSDELYTFDSGTIELHPTDSGSYATLESQWTEYRGDWSRYSEPMSPLAPPNA